MTETREARSAWLHARFAPASFDAEARTVEVVWSTGAPVRRRDWNGDFTEELDMSAGAVDLSRLNAGAPVLAAHEAWSLDAVLGVVERAWLDAGEGKALLRFSERAEVAPILADIRAGILRNISVGYDVEKWDERQGPDGKRIKRAVRWQPAEISLVPIPADASAQVRAAEPPPADAAADGTHSLNPSAADAAEEIRMANEHAAPAPESAGQAAPNIEAERSAAQAAERARIAELRSAARQAPRLGLPDTAVAELEEQAIRDGSDARAFQARLFHAAVSADEAVRAPVRAVAQIGASGDAPDAIREAMADAIAVRAMPGAFRPATERFREFASLRPTEMLLELAMSRGERVSPRSRQQLLERAFHSTSDFPLLLESAGNKMLMAGFAAAAPSYRTFFAQRSFNDFKAHKFLTAGDFPALVEMKEGGEITAGSISEKREQITAKTYGRQVRVTRQMLVNDDLGAFAEFGAMIGRRVADQENALAYALVNTANGDGPTLATGSAAVFGTGAGRANKASSGAAISEASLDLGYAAMMAQKSLDNITLNLQPRILLTGAAYRGAALRYTTRITAAQGGNVGLYSDLTPVADANITGNRWYLFADPVAAPVYVYGYVNGQTAPMVRVHQYVPGTDGIAVEVVHDFAVGAVDHRGGYFNPGA